MLVILLFCSCYVYFGCICSHLETHDTSIDVFDEPFLSPNKACKCGMISFFLLIYLFTALAIWTRVFLGISL